MVLSLEHGQAGAAVSAYVAVAGVALYRLRNLAVPAFKAERQKTAEVLGFWEERLLGTTDIRANGAIAYVMGRQQQLMRQVLEVGRRASVLGYAVHGAYIMVYGSGFALAFAVGAYLYYTGSLSIGAVYLIFYYIGLVAENLRVLVYQLDDLQRAIASIARINELRHNHSRLQDGAYAGSARQPLAVSCDDVSFTYTAGAPVLRNISFSLAPGQVLGLLGPSGSGKSTLARLLFRFYDPDRGPFV
jgi:ATP-binding cassette subfamily B protein